MSRVSYIDALRHWGRDAIRAQRDALGRSSTSVRRAPSLHPIPTGNLYFNPDRGRDILAGRFEFGGHLVDVGAQGHPFSIVLPSERFADWLHSHCWLPDLLGVPGGTEKAQTLINQWISAFDGHNHFVFASDRLARRLFYWGWVLGDLAVASDSVTSRYAGQARALRARYNRVSPGLDKLFAACALVLFGARLDERSESWLARGLDTLDIELEAQILPDGGHVSRSPEETATALLCLQVTDAALHARGVTGSKALTRAMDRLVPMVATLRHADGKLAIFHGGSEGDAAHIERLLKAADSRPVPFSYGPHTKIHRLDAGATTVFLDAGGVAPRPFDLNSHLAPLAMEVSTTDGRLIVNCGWHPGTNETWRRPMRSAAAHSTLILNDQSPGDILDTGFRANVFGPAVLNGPDPVKSRRKEQSSGIWLESSHEGYKEEFGLVHQRRIFMGEDGDDIRGEDSLFVPLGSVPVRRDQIPFTVRFHFHPDVRVSLAQDLSSALLVQNGRAGWRFRTDAGPLSVERSVYLGGSARPVRAQQLVIRGAAYGDGDGQGRDNCVRWSLRRLSNKRNSSATGGAS